MSIPFTGREVGTGSTSSERGETGERGSHAQEGPSPTQHLHGKRSGPPVSPVKGIDTETGGEEKSAPKVAS